tara:strand:- start:46431 stop:48605 length:2175 start_codon:yes stop_codon:yes gene_type:complete
MRIPHLFPSAALLAALSVIPVGCASNWSPDLTPENGLAVFDVLPETSPIAVHADAEAWAEVERIRLQGVDSKGRLEALLQHPEADVRARAAFTIGSLGWVRLERLGLRLKEGETEDVSDLQILTWKGALTRALEDEDDSVRAHAIDALSRLGANTRMLLANPIARDPSPEVAVTVLRALHRLDASRLTDEERSALGEYLGSAPQRVPSDLAGATVLDWKAQAHWSALFAAQRLRLPDRGSSTGLHYILRIGQDDTRSTARVFAAAGIRRTIEPYDPRVAERPDLLENPVALTPGEHRSLLESALGDPDWRVVYELVGALEAYGDPASVPALAGLRRDHSSAHVRAACVKALATIGSKNGDRSVCATEILGANMDASMTVRVEALVAFTSLYGDEVEDGVREAMASKSPTMRAGAARAASHLEAEIGMPILWSLTTDPHPRVAGASYAVLATKIGGEPDDLVRSTLIDHLVAQDDIGLKLGLVMELGPHFTADDVDALASCLGRSNEDIGVELEFNVLQALGAIGTPEALAIVRAGLKHPNEWIQWVCWGELMQHDEVHPEPTVAPKGQGPEVLPSGRPIVEVYTSKGTLTFELYPEDAPLHVLSFLELVGRGHYNGLDFHRVVPNFVIQGGCPRGDGNGGGTWLGEAEALPAEFNPRPYARGVLGMPRNQNPDSNGSQIFVTHRPTPHLDGRYVVFGALLQGFDVLDEIEVGDRIHSAAIVAGE